MALRDPVARPAESASISWISYAQNREDVRLRRAFEGRSDGFYIDVGAYDPVDWSVTKHFYDVGWNGINVEASRERHARMTRERGRDINLNVACTNRTGMVTFYDGERSVDGLSTLVAEQVRIHEKQGWRFRKTTVPGVTLAAICEEHCRDRTIEFLSIDVEGHEREVLEGGDFERWRPRVVVVEATRPKSTELTHDQWESILLDAGYLFVVFDGLNRFYVRREDEALGPELALAPNVLDHFVPYEYQKRFDALEEELDAYEAAAKIPRGVATMAARLGSRAKSMSSRRAFARNAARLRQGRTEPTLTNVVSQLATGEQIASRTYEQWCAALGLPNKRLRKYWEFAWIMQALEEAGMLRDGARGVGFGVGQEPLAAFMAKRGCSIVATDAPPALVPEWMATGQHAEKLDALNASGLCPDDVFRSRATFREVDMNAVPDDLSNFDFCWSACSFEHLGTLDNGLRFVERSLDCIRPGGVAVHTTEFNLSSNDDTVESGRTVLYRQRDIESLVDRLRAAGHQVELNLHPGNHPTDRYVDVPPFAFDPHVKLLVERYVCTSIGLLIRKR